MDIPGIVTSYGVPSERVKLLSELTSAVKDGLSSDRPTLITRSASAASLAPELSVNTQARGSGHPGHAGFVVTSTPRPVAPTISAMTASAPIGPHPQSIALHPSRMPTLANAPRVASAVTWEMPSNRRRSASLPSRT